VTLVPNKVSLNPSAEEEIVSSPESRAQQQANIREKTVEKRMASGFGGKLD